MISTDFFTRFFRVSVGVFYQLYLLFFALFNLPALHVVWRTLSKRNLICVVFREYGSARGMVFTFTLRALKSNKSASVSHGICRI